MVRKLRPGRWDSRLGGALSIARIRDGAGGHGSAARAWRSRDPTRPSFARRSSSASARRRSRAARRSIRTALISSGPSRPPRSRRSSWTISRSARCAASRERTCGSTPGSCASARRTGSTTSSTASRFGGSYDVPAYGPLSYTRPGVPQGRISEKLVHTSKLYGGMETNYWIYVPAQYDPAVPAALMVWQDGERYITRNVGGDRAACARACTACRKSPTI